MYAIQGFRKIRVTHERIHKNRFNVDTTNVGCQPSTPTVSIIMAVFNAAAYVGRSIRSVLAQTFTDFELICVDDGSSDNSVKVLQEWALHESRIRVIQNPHQGACATLNAGLDAATGRYVAFLDNDDAYHPRTLELAVSALEQNHLDIVIWDRVEVDENGCEAVSFAPLNQIPDVEAIQDYVGWGRGDHHVAFWCKLYRSEVIADVRFETRIVYGDLLFFWKIFSKPGLSVGHLPIALHWYCVRPGSVIHSPMDERKAIDKVRALEYIHGYVASDEALWSRIRREVFPDRVWSIFKMMRNNPAARNVLLASMKRILASGTFHWDDLPLRRRIKMRLAFSVWSFKRRTAHEVVR